MVTGYNTGNGPVAVQIGAEAVAKARTTEAEEVTGVIQLRPGTKRARLYEALLAAPGTEIPAPQLVPPDGKGAKYAVDRLNEKLRDSGSNWEIRAAKENNVVLYGLFEKTGG